MDDEPLLSWKSIEANAIHMVRHGKVVLYDMNEEDDRDSGVDFEKLFGWFWARKILQVVAINTTRNGSLNAFTYNPFPVMQILNTSLQQPYQDVLKNLMGYPIRSFVLNDPPRAFQYRNKQGVRVFAGYGAKTMQAFIEKHNGTLFELDSKNYTHMDGFLLNELFSRNQIDITMHPYVNLFREIRTSYPLIRVQMGVLIPAAQDISASLYNIFPFQPRMWYLLCVYIFYVTLTILIARTKHNLNLRYIEMFLNSIGTVVSIIPPTTEYQFCWQSRVILLLAAFFGGIVSSIYQSTLSSCYTTKIYGKQMKTIDDMIKNNLTIMVINFEWAYQKGIVLPERFQNQFDNVTIDVIFKHRDNLNTSFGYLIASDRATFLLEQQKNFERPLFKTQIYTLFAGSLMFLMEHYTPYQEALDRVILQCFQSGLFEKWLKGAYDDAVQAGLYKRIKEPESKYRPLTMNYFEYFWKLWCGGMIMALTSLLFEIILQSTSSLNGT